MKPGTLVKLREPVVPAPNYIVIDAFWIGQTRMLLLAYEFAADRELVTSALVGRAEDFEEA